ncbi:hypothetical protein D0B54_19510 [Solimonas sp. K1W22B-7]|uniref:hypothetical protein n=1 Tax=Solimonas sp. K1W22B-7 TaxID=2303331 RepID=UPI000E32E968|nr:hypothetical protein [Solimonas sp. K1W22B-7]AXQ30735.1 hypothetical protein D0B54_19510 [Solimonas sp. K1W22B-7]
MNYSAWKNLGNQGVAAAALLAGGLGQAQAAVQAGVPVAPAYVPGVAMMEAGGYGGGAVLIWASVLLLTFLCFAALVLLLRQPQDAVAVQVPAVAVPEPQPRAAQEPLPVARKVVPLRAAVPAEPAFALSAPPPRGTWALRA